MKLELVAPDYPVLRERARFIRAAPDTLLADMWDTLHMREALGLAAPQIGIPVRLAIVYVSGVSRVLLNPVILWRSETTTTEEEGCLSLPGVSVAVPRSIAILLEGEPVPFEGLLARAVQHEIDHLNGKLITDYAVLAQGRDE